MHLCPGRSAIEIGHRSAPDSTTASRRLNGAPMAESIRVAYLVLFARRCALDWDHDRRDSGAANREWPYCCRRQHSWTQKGGEGEPRNEDRQREGARILDTQSSVWVPAHRRTIVESRYRRWRRGYLLPTPTIVSQCRKEIGRVVMEAGHRLFQLPRNSSCSLVVAAQLQ